MGHGDLWFWMGITAAVIVTTVLLGKYWFQCLALFKKHLGRGDKVTANCLLRYFRNVAVLTLLMVFALFALIVGQGQAASPINANIQPGLPPLPSFVKADEQTRQALVPKTPDQIREEQKEEDETAKKAIIDDNLQINREVGESMNDFRKRVLERAQPQPADVPPGQK
jgi:hypothetical protein